MTFPLYGICLAWKAICHHYKKRVGETEAHSFSPNNIWMVPVPIAARHSQSSRLIYILFSLGTQYVPHFIRRTFGDTPALSYVPTLAKRNDDIPKQSVKFIVFASIIPFLVLLSGLFAGLTLGYMSLDETQLNVLSISGTPYVSPSSL